MILKSTSQFVKTTEYVLTILIVTTVKKKKKSNTGW